ncbi:MAG: hypothetical protein ABL985_14855 [Casimicrobium sp.]
MSWFKQLFQANSTTGSAQPQSIMQVVEDARATYQSVLLQLATDAKQQYSDVHTEIQIKLNLDDTPMPFQLMRVDALYQDGEKVGTLEANLKAPWKFRTFSEQWGSLNVTVSPLVWNGLEFKVLGPAINAEVLSTWHHVWYDADDTREADASGFHGVVHNVTAPEITTSGWSISVDFGSSDLDAFSALVEKIKESGATDLQIGSFSYGPANS